MSYTWTLVNNIANITNMISYRNGQSTVAVGTNLFIDFSANTVFAYSNDNGNTFTNTSYGFSQLIATYINSSNNIVIGSDASYRIYKSLDGGETFTRYPSIGEMTGIYGITIDTTGNNIIVLGRSSNRGLFRYNNNTNNWDTLYTFGNGYTLQSITNSSNGQYIYVLNNTSSANYVLISADYGATFNNILLPRTGSGILPNAVKIVCTASGSIVYYITVGTTYISTNYGSNGSWNAIVPDISITGYFQDIAVCSIGTNVIILSNGTQNKTNLYYSVNGGINWNTYLVSNTYSSTNSVDISSDGTGLYATASGLGLYYYQNFSDSSNLACFHESTKILTNLGYRVIRDLRKGDLIQTVDHGYVPIDMIGCRTMQHRATTVDRIKDQLYLCSKSQYPGALFEDLIITGCHSILVKQFDSDEQREKTESLLGDVYITDNHYRLPACLDDRAAVYDKPGEYVIYHFALVNDDYYMNYGVYANGLLVETSSRRFMTELAGMTLIE